MTTDAVMRLGTALARHAEVRERLSSAVVTGMMSKVVAVWKRGQEIGAVRDDLSVPRTRIAAHAVTLDQRYTETELSGHRGYRKPGSAGTDHGEVPLAVRISHGLSRGGAA